MTFMESILAGAGSFFGNLGDGALKLIRDWLTGADLREGDTALRWLPILGGAVLALIFIGLIRRTRR